MQIGRAPASVALARLGSAGRVAGTCRVTGGGAVASRARIDASTSSQSATTDRSSCADAPGIIANSMSSGPEIAMPRRAGASDPLCSLDQPSSSRPRRPPIERSRSRSTRDMSCAASRRYPCSAPSLRRSTLSTKFPKRWSGIQRYVLVPAREETGESSRYAPSRQRPFHAGNSSSLRSRIAAPISRNVRTVRSSSEGSRSSASCRCRSAPNGTSETTRGSSRNP